MKLAKTKIIGDNIRQIREVVKNYKHSYVAEQLKITTRAYTNIENNVGDIALKKLEEIANIFVCRPADILITKKSRSDLTANTSTGHSYTPEIINPKKDNTIFFLFPTPIPQESG